FNMHREIRRQRRVLLVQTVLIFALMLGVLLLSGLRIVGALGLAVVLGMGSFFFVSVQNRASELTPQNAVPLERTNAPALHAILEELAERAELPRTPDVYLLPAGMMNAATLGSREHPILIVTPPLLDTLSRNEVRAVLAHEVAHVRDNDLMSYRIAEAIAMITVVISRVGWLLVLLYLPVLLVSDVEIPLGLIAILLIAPAASVLLQMALSRSREFSADLGAVELTDEPLALASALQKIDNVGRSMLHQVLPLPKKRNSSVFRSHPAISRRVERLQGLAGAGA
ncbi:MAG: M48 family metalloprotease, partial [Spirochaetes bacterium]|nr:M48 family metalloprotease [Spirochaetota bacterium]